MNNEILVILLICILGMLVFLSMIILLVKNFYQMKNAMQLLETIRNMAKTKGYTPDHDVDQAQANLKLAEANLVLMGKKELLEKQQWQLAEANLRLLELQEELVTEQHKSEKLLKNILPERVAHELKEHGVSTPECFENVSVFFSDIVDFTQTAATMEPQEVISELSTIFTVFDRIFIKNGCERIKTIGDAYLGVSGMPLADKKHAENIINAAVEVIAYLKARNRTAKFKWQVRVGVHTGKVVGGIVGTEKYIYDLFGDTINIAARMEHHSEPMRINVSETTYKITKHRFNFVKRELIEVKGKGIQQMYLL